MELSLQTSEVHSAVELEVLTAVIVKNAVFWFVTYRIHLQDVRGTILAFVCGKPREISVRSADVSCKMCTSYLPIMKYNDEDVRVPS
jgi:hypothetical protein